MSNELAVLETEKNALSAIDIRRQVNLIQEVMKEVMQKDVHFGVIPGTDKPALLKAGAEKLLMTFRLGASYDELPGSSESDNFICYKIKCTLTHIGSGNVVGSAIGTCNSKEKKYRTRSVYANKATAEEKKIGEKQTRATKDGKTYDVYVVPQDPWDIQNTIYKMACKRALIASVINATGASDIFNQDIEEVDEVDYSNSKPAKTAKPAVDMPKAKPAESKQESPVVEESPISIREALTKEDGETFDVIGSLTDYSETTFKKKSDGTEGDKTTYCIIDDNDDEIVITKFGKLKANVEKGDTIRMIKVFVSTYRDKKQYMANDVVLMRKA
jgi:hypothetical protein